MHKFKHKQLLTLTNGKHHDGKGLYISITSPGTGKWSLRYRLDHKSREMQSIISNALNNEELDLFKKANIALRYLSLMKGKDDLLEQSKRQLSSYQYDNRLNVF